MPVRRWKPLSLLVATVVGVVLTLQLTTSATAATQLTVAQAIAQQGAASATVRDYVVGQPTATTIVARSNFPNDYALADSAAETNTSKILYVQITTGFRAQYGLQSNPGLIGKQLDVTGKLAAYFSHAGLTSPTAFALVTGTPSSSTTTTAPPTTTTSTPSDSYYQNALGKTGAALRSALHQIISTNTKLSYDQVWEALKSTDEDPANPDNVILVYSSRSQSKSTNGGDVNDWNREHVWAKSHGDFGTATGPGNDLHHLRPEDVSVNSDRSNKDLDMGGTPVSEAPGSYTDSDSF